MAFITLGKLFGKTVKIAVNPINNQPGDIILQLDAGNSDSINLSNVKDTSGSNTGDQTITLTGDASGTGTHNIPVTVTSVGGSSAGNVHSAEVKVTGSAVTQTELGYVHGVTSSVQTQINNKMPYVVPGTSGNVLTSDGSIWTSAPSSGSSPIWGNITGTLSDQTDLQAELDAKQDTLTLGNLTDPGTDGIIITNGNGAVVGSGTSISQHVADSTHNGYLSSTDWSTFNSKGSGTVTSVSVATANGLAGSSSGGATPSLTLSTTITGVLKGNGTAVSAASAGDFPTLNQNTTGSAAKWTTSRNLAGNSVDGSADVAFSNKFIVQGTTDTGLSGAQFLGALGTGIVKNTTSTGVLSIAIAADFPTLNQSTTGNAGTSTAPQTGSAHGAVTLDSSAHFQSVSPGAAGGYLRSDGTDFVRNTIQVSDVPTLNQNTTGTASNVTATSNATLTTLSSLSLPGSQVTGNISGNAGNVTGTVAINHGGSGQTTANSALNAFLPTQTGNNGKFLQTDGSDSSWQTATAATYNYWNGYNNGGNWSTSSSSFVDPTVNNAGTLFERQNNGFGAVVAEGSGLPGITFTPTSANAIYLVQVNAIIYNPADWAEVQLTDGTNVISKAGVFSIAASCPLSGIWAPGTGSPVTLKIQATIGSGSNTTYIRYGYLTNSIEFTLTQLAL